MEMEKKVLYKEKLLSGVSMYDRMSQILSNKLEEIKKINDIKVQKPKLAVLNAREKKESSVYIKNKSELCSLLGLECSYKQFKEEISFEELLKEIQLTNEDANTNGIILQLPLPSHLNNKKFELLSAIHCSKDVDGLHPYNQGTLLNLPLKECIIPPTALGCLELLRLAVEFKNDYEQYFQYFEKNPFENKEVDLSPYKATVIGRGIVSGLPCFTILQKCNATVQLCHSKTKNIEEQLLEADIVISACGIPKCIKTLKKDAIVLDVGINFIQENENAEHKLVGDCDLEKIIKTCSYISPVPGGSGKMTVLMLIRNVIKAWIQQNNYKQ